jgi:ABC-type transport system involved in multi-copper enzyme maturation permease subunit
MSWLLWKEYRENRPICIAGAAVLLLPYAIVSIVMGLASLGMIRGPVRLGEALVGASLYSLWASQLTLVLLGGNLIAGERVDRSAEFLAYLPLSRGRAVVGKLLLTLLAAVAIWSLNGTILMVYNAGPDRVDDLPAILGLAAVLGFTFFGVSWLVSALQSSPTFAVFAGLVFPLLIVMSLHAVNEFLLDQRLTHNTVLQWFVAGCLVPAVASFVAGTCYHLRRVEP